MNLTGVGESFITSDTSKNLWTRLATGNDRVHQMSPRRVAMTSKALDTAHSTGKR
jgi:hypothetical protein